ncbi:MAG TPA: hypothetical protein VKB72_03400 [Steroidobacteraceae bacterium]|nr:hypothetical protein [Steroidobacteraceae bacterium]
MLIRLLPALGVIAGFATSSWAQEASAPAVTTQTQTLEATVQAVYPDKRSLTLLGPSGQPRAIFVGPDVRLDRLHVGDKVKVRYVQGIAAQMSKGGTKVSDPAASDFTFKNPNGAPGGGAGSSVTVSVKILGVNPSSNTVAFEDSDGQQHVIAVKSPNMRKFIRTLKAGDHVDVTYTESVAISVTPATT